MILPGLFQSYSCRFNCQHRCGFIFEAILRSRMPLRLTIHSSLVSTIFSKSKLVITFGEHLSNSQYFHRSIIQITSSFFSTSEKPISPSATIVSLTFAMQFNLPILLRILRSSTLIINWSPGTTGFLIFTLSIVVK